MSRHFRFWMVSLLILVSFTASAQKLDLNQEYVRLQSAIEKNPENLDLKMDLAFLFSQGLEWDRAIRIYQDVLIKDANNLRATTELCALYTDSRQEDLAHGQCQKATELDPKNEFVFDNLGLFYFKFGHFRESLKPFLDALSLNPKSALVKTHLAQAFLAMKEYQAAKVYYEDLLKNADLKGQDRAMAHYGLFLVHKGLKDYDHAFTQIKETYKLSGNQLFIGQVISTFMLAHQALFFFLFGGVILLGANYLGKRLNRFLKNED